MSRPSDGAFQASNQIMEFSQGTCQPPHRFSPQSCEQICTDSFLCQVCPEAFTPGMTPHLAVDCEKTPHLCTSCGRQFAIMHALWLHRTMHAELHPNDLTDGHAVHADDVDQQSQSLPPFPTLDNWLYSSVQHSPSKRNASKKGKNTAKFKGGGRSRRLSDAQKARRSGTREPLTATEGAGAISVPGSSEGSAAYIAPSGFPQENALKGKKGACKKGKKGASKKRKKGKGARKKKKKGKKGAHKKKKKGKKRACKRGKRGKRGERKKGKKAELKKRNNAAATSTWYVTASSTTPRLQRCSTCSFLFVSKDKLWLHRMCAHDESAYTCEQCMLCFRKKKKLAKHISAVHGRR